MMDACSLMNDLITVDPDAFQLRVFFDRGNITVRLILQGKKANNLLREIVFTDKIKEKVRQLYLEQLDNKW